MFIWSKIGPKSLGSWRQGICKDKESNLGSVASYKGWNYPELSCIFVFRVKHHKARDYQGKRVNPPCRSSEVICLKLFLDIVPSSSEDITYAMRGQPKRLSRITWEKWRERHFICFGFVSYRRCFLHSQPPFCVVGHFICFSARLAVHYFAIYSVLGS